MENEKAVQNYFLLAFTSHKQSPQQLYFDLFLLNSLKLPCPTSKSQDGEGHVTFKSQLAAMEYCLTVMDKWKQINCAVSIITTSHYPCKTNSDMDGETLFQSESRSLQRVMESKDGEFDCNLIGEFTT